MSKFLRNLRGETIVVILITMTYISNRDMDIFVTGFYWLTVYAIFNQFDYLERKIYGRICVLFTIIIVMSFIIGKIALNVLK